MGIRHLLIASVLASTVVACANDPEYVQCGATDMMDLCIIDSANATGSGDTASAKGSLHVPVMPPDMDLQKITTALQMTMPAGVDVPIYRLDQYDLSVEWTVKNLDNKDGQFKLALNGANEMFAWDPSLIMPADDEAPPAPSLSGDIPTDIAAMGSVDGVFREDQLLEAAIDLDQISRANINPFAATLIINKNDPSFQPLSVQLPPPPGSNEPPMQTPVGSAVPRSAFRQFVRVDLALKTSGVHLTVSYALRVRPHVDKVIHDKGMDAPAAEIMIYDPPSYMPGPAP